MSDLIKKLKSEGNFIDAYLVAKNILSRNIGDVTAFNDFIEITLEIASYDILFEERKQYISDANSALEMFSESVDINEDIIALIKETRKRINDATKVILNSEKEYMDHINRQIEDENTEKLNRLAQIYCDIQSAKTQEEFDVILSRVAEIEETLNKDMFSKDQERTYEKLTQQYSKAISSQMEIINRNELLEYNKRAVSCFNDVFLSFKKEPSKYKNEVNLRTLMTTKFFVFDSSKLFNESLVFYNHVYSLIFQESSNDLKYKLTKWALNTTKLEK